MYQGGLNSTVIRLGTASARLSPSGAAAVVLVHNHPSGDPTPSPEDIRLTADAGRAGNLLGVELLDHVVIGRSSHVSLREHGLYSPIATDGMSVTAGRTARPAVTCPKTEVADARHRYRDDGGARRTHGAMASKPVLSVPRPGHAGVEATEIQKLPFDLSALEDEGVFVNVDASGFGLLDRRLEWHALGVSLPRGTNLAFRPPRCGLLSGSLPSPIAPPSRCAPTRRCTSTRIGSR